eukprot:411088_1
MTEAFTKKATHILDQATSKDNLKEYDIAYKLYCDGIEYFDTAINYETNPLIKQQMIERTREYKLRAEYLNKCLKKEACKWNNIIPIHDFQNGIIIRMSSISISEMQNEDEDETVDQTDEEQDIDEDKYEIIADETGPDPQNETDDEGITEKVRDDESCNSCSRDESVNKIEIVAPNKCNCFGFF